MATNSNGESLKAGVDPKTRIFDPFSFKPQWTKKKVLEPIEVDLAFDIGYSSQSTFYKTSRSILYLNRIVGRMPFHMKSGWMRYSYKSFSFYYSISLTISYTILLICNKGTFHNAWTKISSSDRHEHTFESIMFSCMLIMQVPTIPVVIYSWFFEVPVIVRSYNMTAVVEKRISDVFPTCAFTARTRGFVTASVALYFVGVMIVGSLVLTSRFHQAPWIAVLTFVFNFVSSHSSCVAWCFNFLYVSSLACRLKEHMVKCLELEENRTFKLKICRKIWMTVWKLSRMFADGFAITLLLVLIGNGIIFVIAAYGLIASVRHDGSLMEKLQISPYFLTSLFNVASVFETAHRAKNMLGEQFICTLMAMDKDTLDQESAEEVDRFMNMISYTENAKITLRGFVTVDRALLVSFLSYSVTYLIVLIQFQDKTDEENVADYV